MKKGRRRMERKLKRNIQISQENVIAKKDSSYLFCTLSLSSSFLIRNYYCNFFTLRPHRSAFVHFSINSNLRFNYDITFSLLE